MKLRGISDGALLRIARNMTKDSLSYPGNLGFVEMMEFYGKATAEQKDRMSRLLDEGDYEGVWELLKEVTGRDLEDL